MGTVIQMVAASTGGTESALANIDCPMNGVIEGIEWACRADLDTDNDRQQWQVSFGTTYTSANDARQVISNVTLGGLTFTAGGSVIGQANQYTPLPDVPVGMGERIYLHSDAAGSVVGTGIAALHFSFDLDKVSVRRR